MKLAIQIPAYNEADWIGKALEDIQKNFFLAETCFQSYDILVMNDGSSDATLAILNKTPGIHIINLTRHEGLGVAYRKGLAKALELGADCIVNIDADLQYQAKDIGKLIQPVIEGYADMSIGDRQISKLMDYPAFKKITQHLGNRMISWLYQSSVKDSTSGFRAVNRETAKFLLLHLKNSYTYTIEALCLLLKQKKKIAFIPVQTRKSVRHSRLITSKIGYVKIYLKEVFACRFLT